MSNSFLVTRIINGNTIEVSPKWGWNNTSGSIVIVEGYDITNYKNLSDKIHSIRCAIATNRLSKLLYKDSIVLVSPTEINENGFIKCKVYLRGNDISIYFPDYTKKNMGFFTKLWSGYRLLLGFCPKCNSDAPEIYKCKVCCGKTLPNKELKKIWWEKYLNLV